MSSREEKCVLVVDDAPANIRAANEILGSAHRVKIATDGSRASESAVADLTDPYPLVLEDFQMPWMGGVRLPYC